MADNRRFIVEIIGENPAKAWGLTSTERLKRMLHAEKIEVASARTPDLPLLVADSDYIFERLWLRLALNTPGSVLTIEGRPVLAHLPDHTRSEEHTSELQSLMRISYAVFCLKKKKIIYRKEVSTHSTQPHIQIAPHTS